MATTGIQNSAVTATTKIFTPLADGDVIKNASQIVTNAIWSTGEGELTTLATSSAQATGSLSLIHI